MHCSIAGQRLRAENILANSLSMWVMTSWVDGDDYVCLSRETRLPEPTNITSDLIKAAHDCLAACYKPGIGFLKGGVMLLDLENEARR